MNKIFNEIFAFLGLAMVGVVEGNPVWQTANGTDKSFKRISAEEVAKLNDADFNAYSDALEAHKEAQLEMVKNSTATKEELSNAVLEIKNSIDSQYEILKVQGANIKAQQSVNPALVSAEMQISKFIEDNFEEIQKLHSAKNGTIEVEFKAPADITTGSGTIPVAAPSITGVQQAPISNVNLRDSWVLPLTTNLNTSLAAYPYTETVPKDGDYTFLAECEVKPQIDFKWETRFATPVKTAAWERICDEAIQDVAGLQSVAIDYLRKKHDLKKQNGILFGDGVAPNPKGATVYGRAFVAGSMAASVASPTITDVINACITDIYTTHNYVDEMSYRPSLVVMNPVDFFLEFVAPKTTDGLPLYPTASLFNEINMGGITIRPERDIPAGKVFVADMSKYNTTNYMPYRVTFGWVNDDFIKNQFVILGESRFHAFVKNLDEQAFIYDDIATIKAAILKP